MKKLKILEIARSFYPSVGGLEKFVSDRKIIYQQLGFEYSLITTNYNTGKFDFSVSHENTKYLPQYTPYNVCPGVFKTIKFDADFLSINQTGNFLSDYALWYAHNNRIKAVLTPHMYFHTSKNGLLKNIHKRFFSPWLFKIPEKIVCFSEYEKNFLMENFFVQENKIVVISHYYKNINEVSCIDENFILYLGRASANKKLDLLISAYNQISDPPFKLFLTVNKEGINLTSQKIVSQNNNILLLGYVDEIRKQELLRTASALILPSDYEAFGIVLLEASEFGKPLLCSNLKIFQEILNPSGVLYFENKQKSLFKVLLKFSKTEKSDRQLMGEINKKNLERFVYETILKQYQQLFESFY